MDKEIWKLLEQAIRDQLGELVSHELKLRFEPIQKQIDSIQKGQDGIVEQLREDRKDINQIKIDQAKSITQNKVIIENQNNQEKDLIDAITEETKKIPNKVEKSVETMFANQPFLKRLLERFKK